MKFPDDFDKIAPLSEHFGELSEHWEFWFSLSASLLSSFYKNEPDDVATQGWKDGVAVGLGGLAYVCDKDVGLLIPAAVEQRLQKVDMASIMAPEVSGIIKYQIFDSRAKLQEQVGKLLEAKIGVGLPAVGPNPAMGAQPAWLKIRTDFENIDQPDCSILEDFLPEIARLLHKLMKNTQKAPDMIEWESEGGQSPFSL